MISFKKKKKLSILCSSSTHRRFYPQRFSGQAVVTGVVPSHPRYVPSFLSRIGFSIPTARRFSSNIANSRSRAFRYINFYARKSPYEYVHSARIEPTKLILVGTRKTYQATGDAGVMALNDLKPQSACGSVSCAWGAHFVVRRGNHRRNIA